MCSCDNNSCPLRLRLRSNTMSCSHRAGCSWIQHRFGAPRNDVRWASNDFAPRNDGARSGALSGALSFSTRTLKHAPGRRAGEACVAFLGLRLSPVLFGATLCAEDALGGWRRVISSVARAQTLTGAIQIYNHERDVGWLAGWLVGRSVGRLVGWLVVQDGGH